jgi:hypothetical protein
MNHKKINFSIRVIFGESKWRDLVTETNINVTLNPMANYGIIPLDDIF